MQRCVEYFSNSIAHLEAKCTDLGLQIHKNVWLGLTIRMNTLTKASSDKGM